MSDSKKDGQSARARQRDNFSNKGHKLVTPSTQPGQRPKPQPPKPAGK